LAISWLEYETDPKAVVDTLRVLEAVNEGADKYNHILSFFPSFTNRHFEVAEWTVDRIMDASYHVSHLTNIHSIVWTFGSGRNTENLKFLLSKFMNHNRVYWLSVIQSTEMLDSLFWDETESESAVLGEIWINILQGYGVNIENYLREQLAARPNGMLEENVWGNIGRRLCIEHTAWGKWTLGWEWVYDPSAPGVLIQSDHRAIIDWASHCICTEDSWPFFWEHAPGWYEKGELQPERFERRMARKARKELKRSEQKVARREMPGSWID
jgi:hypothetical protein